MNFSALRWTLKSQKLLPKKSIKNTVLSARLRADKAIQNKSKFHQKSLTQAWDFFSFNDKIRHA